MSRTRIAGAALVVAALVAAALWWSMGRNGGDDEALRASGTIEATETDLGFQAPGRIERLVPREGDRVRRGDTLAALDDAEQRALLEAAEARVDAADARLRELRAGTRSQEVSRLGAGLAAAREREAEARREAERARRLHEGGAVSSQALERAESALETASAAREQAELALHMAEEGPRPEVLEAQEALLRQARAAAAQASAALARTVLVAPHDGLVTVRHREPGEIVPAGAPVLTLMDPGDRWVRIYVREDRLGRVALGAAAEIRIDTFADRTWRGRVVHIGNEAEFTPRNVQTPDERTQLVYSVKVRIEGDEALELKPGLPADVRLEEGGA